MPKTANHVLAWNPEQRCYLLYEHACEHALPLQEEGGVWLAWLTGHSSFAFHGKSGQLTLLKEARKRGDEGYWYAYRRQGKRMHKKYAGRSADLTPLRLEAIAQTLGIATDEAGAQETVPASPVRDQTTMKSSLFHGAASTQIVRGGQHAGNAKPGERSLLQREQLLEPKLRLPRLHASLVERVRLFSMLDVVRECKLMLLSAPAGSGKTTLVRQWIASRSLHDQLPHVAWLSLDAGDNDPARFWRYVITACRMFQADAGQFALYLLAATMQPPFKSLSLEEVLTTFLNAISRSAQEGILILEDYHLISEVRIHELMAFLLDHLPTNLHLVILSRNDPALPLARLRAGGDLCELHAADLRFSLEEMTAFLQQNLSCEASVLSGDVLRQLDMRLEGWAAGLRLFTLTLNGHVNQQEIEYALTNLAGNRRTFQEYFVTEVLSTQSEPAQQFLLYTSVLSRLTGSLCDAVTGRDDSGQMLATLEREGLFLEALDDEGQWYRYHALFAEAMRSEARRRFNEEALHALSAKASHWYEQHGLQAEAIEASLQAKDVVRSAELIEHFLNTVWCAKAALPGNQTYEFHTMYRWLEQLPESLMRQHPPLCFAYASSIMFAFIMDRPSVAPEMYVRFEKALQMAEDGWRDAGDMVGLSHALAFRTVLARYQGEIVQAITWARQALDWLPASEFVWRAICLGVVGHDELLKGQFILARKTTLETRAISEATGHPAFIRASSVVLSNVCFEQGELHLAAEYYRQMLSEAREADDRDDIGQASLGLALLSYEWNDLSTAEQQAQEALECGQLLASHEFQVQSTLLLARIAHARGQTTAAQQRCIALQARLSTHTAPLLYWYSRQVQTLQARLALAVGDHATVQRWMDNRAQHDEQLPLIYREMEALVEARWLIIQEKETEALALLTHWLDDARQNGRVRAALEMQVLMVMAYASHKQVQEARFLLQSVLSQASAEGYLRLFLDEGAPMATLLRTMVPYLREPSLLTYLQTILQAFTLEQEGLQQEPRKIVAPLIEPLSPQEQRVLRLLVAGRSNREIADELIVSVNTVRSHVQSIYRKLNVSNRVAASEMARHLL